MTAALPNISREELWKKIQCGADFVLVDALGPMAYAMSHLPGAINITPDWIDDRARRRIPDADTEVVVYCADIACDSSIHVANRLLELGYRNVRHYAAGKRDWVDGGLPLEGGRDRHVEGRHALLRGHQRPPRGRLASSSVTAIRPVGCCRQRKTSSVLASV